MLISTLFVTFGLITNCLSLGLYSNLIRRLREKTPFTLEEALFYYRPKSFDGSWISDNELQFRDSNSGNFMVYDVNTGNIDLFFDYDLLENVTSVSDVSFSNDRKFALIGYNRKQVFRHSAVAQYKIYSIENKWFIDVANSSYLQLAHWAPKGLGIAYVFDNDLYYITSFNNEGETSIRISTTGIPGVVYNGIADWVYEEEILAVSEAFTFSPDGAYLFFTTFNDTDVPDFQYPYYGSPGLGTQYPELLSLRYPKAGAANPSFAMHGLYLKKGSVEEAPFPVSREASLDIFLGQKWANDNYTYFSFANRVQNETVTWLCQAWTPGMCSTIYEQKMSNGWANIKLPEVNSKADKFLKIEPRPYKDGRSFPHLKLFNINGDSKFLTQGQFAVLDIIGWDEDKQTIYFTATEENEPARKQVYSVKEDGTVFYCLSCQLISPEKNRCESATAKFSQKYTYVVLTCTGPDPLVSYLYKNEIKLLTPISILEDNASLRQKLQSKLLPSRLDLRVEVPGPFQAEARLLLPPNFDQSGETKYPMIIYVYAGPESKQIDDAYSISFTNSYLTTNLNIIIGLIDGRGSDQKETEMMHAVYRNMGSVEIEDQINVTKYLQNKYDFIDRNRTAIWGWSYGGYATAKALESDTENVFKCGISVAPVSSWLLYDSIYTERYMGLPTEEDNLSGYMESNLYKVDNLKKKKYYLIHGTGDDNVHYQQSMLFSKMLEVNDVLFQQQSYTDENHSLGGVTLHLYHSMVAFWKDCFNLK